MKVRLGDYIKEYSVRNKSGEDIPVYSVTNTHGFCKDYFGKDVSSKDRNSYKIVPRGYFAYNPSRINVGSVDWQRQEDRVIVSPLYNVFSVSPELDQQYLYYYLKSNIGLFYIKAAATGSVRDNLKLSMLYEFEINLPSVEEQQKIVKRLDILEKTIEQYKQEIQTLNELIKARFVEMFGTVYNNRKHFEIKPLVDISEQFFAGGDKPAEFSEKKIGNYIYPVFANGYENKGLQGFTTKCRINKPAVTVSARGTIGYSFIREPNFTPIIRLITIVPNSTVTVQYLKHAIDNMNITSSGTSQSQLTVPNFKKAKIIVPPIDLQGEFSSFVKQVDKSKGVVQKALDEAQLLFDSLMQEYFV